MSNEEEEERKRQEVIFWHARQEASKLGLRIISNEFPTALAKLHDASVQLEPKKKKERPVIRPKRREQKLQKHTR